MKRNRKNKRAQIWRGNPIGGGVFEDSISLTIVKTHASIVRAGYGFSSVLRWTTSRLRGIICVLALRRHYDASQRRPKRAKNVLRSCRGLVSRPHGAPRVHSPTAARS